jgi:metal-responsive CopG/Arc/MetJ family transcriptional regulator
MTMKSITIHGIDGALVEKIERKSKEMKQSRNKTIKLILRESLSESSLSDRERQFSNLFGRWFEEKKAEFEERVRDLEHLDESDWKTT